MNSKQVTVIMCSFSTKDVAVLPVKRIIGKHCLDNASFNHLIFSKIVIVVVRIIIRNH